jgi:hypothetical protein
VRVAAEEAGSLSFGLLDDLLDAEARRVAGAEVRARLAQRPRDRFADLVWDLRATRRVEEGEGAPQRREAAANSTGVNRFR